MALRTRVLGLVLVPFGLVPAGCGDDDPLPGDTDDATATEATPDPDSTSTAEPDETADETTDDSSSGEPPPDEAFAEFDAVIEQFIADQGLMGATAAIVHRDDGVLHLRGYDTFDAERQFLIASASKTISVGVLMKLSDDGLLDIDTPISEYLGDWGEYKTDISVAQLVSNSSGMVGLDDALYANYLCMFYDFETLQTCGEMLYTADDAAASVPPDTEFRYGGAQWQLAGAVAEAVSGQSWADLVEETFAPCGLTSTAYRNHFLQAAEMDGADIAYPSFVDGDMSVLSDTDNPNIEGGAYSSIDDYAKLLLMHLRGGECDEGQALSEDAVARMQHDRILEAYRGFSGQEAFAGYGMGWWVDRQSALISDFGAYGANPWLDLDRGYGAVVFIEGDPTMGPALFAELEPILRAHFDEG